MPEFSQQPDFDMQLLCRTQRAVRKVPDGSTIPASAHNCRHASHPTVDALFVDEPSPTEDRKRQKEQEKERKMNGETVKKKKQIVKQ